MQVIINATLGFQAILTPTFICKSMVHFNINAFRGLKTIFKTFNMQIGANGCSLLDRRQK